MDESAASESVDAATEVPVDESAASESVDAAIEDPVDETVLDVPVTTFRVMTLDSVLYDLTDPSPQAHLIEAESPYRYLVVPVALADAISLQAALTRVEGRRPSTHELMTTILGRLQVDVIAVRIVRYEGSVFYAELELMTTKGREIFDCRTSDALALAYRQIVPAPVLCADDVFDVYFRD